MTLNHLRPLATLALTLSAPLYAADNPSAHQHGHAELQLAISGDRADLFFTSPAHNLLGFEHEARTDEQKQHVHSVREWLATTPLISTGDIDCQITDANVDIEAMEHRGRHDENDHNHEHDDHDQTEQQRHSDIEVTQVLNCPGIDSTKALITALPEQFTAISQLEISWVSSAGQGSARLKDGETTFSLAP